MKRIHLAGLSLACSFALVTACGEKEAATTDTMAMRADSTVAANTGTMGTTTGAGSLADPSTTAQIDSVAAAAAASGGLTSIAPSLAVPLIRSLEQKLDATEDAALDDIADELEKLREELEGTDINGGDIANILERLGPKVQAVAPRAGAAQTQLNAIATALTAAVPKLRGGK